MGVSFQFPNWPFAAPNYMTAAWFIAAMVFALRTSGRRANDR